jgi:hypothetical protein
MVSQDQASKQQRAIDNHGLTVTYGASAAAGSLEDIITLQVVPIHPNRWLLEQVIRHYFPISLPILQGRETSN